MVGEREVLERTEGMTRRSPGRGTDSEGGRGLSVQGGRRGRAQVFSGGHEGLLINEAQDMSPPPFFLFAYF